MQVCAALACVALLLFAFAALTRAHDHGGSQLVDRQVADLTHSLIHPHGLLTQIGNRLERLGAPNGSLAFFIVLVIALVCLGRRRPALAVICVMAMLTAIEVKLRLHIRIADLPSIVAHPHGRHLISSAYPSGHVARVTAFALILALQLPGRFRYPGIALALLGAALVMLVHRYDWGHTGTDVFGGLLLGLSGAAVYAALLAVSSMFLRGGRWER